MKYLFIVILLTVVAIFPGNSQEPGIQSGNIVLQGIVIDAGSMIPLGGTQILINRFFTGVSDEQGKFALSVIKGDTIFFSRLGYKSVSMNVSDTLSGNEFIAGIYMHQDTLTAGEILIIPRISNLKSEILKPKTELNPQNENAKYNLAVSSYQAKVNQNQLGDPSINYEVLRQKQRSEAYSKGQIPADKMLGLSPFMLIPAAYLLMNGLPEKPKMKQLPLSDYEIDQLHKNYLKNKLK